MKNQLFSSLIVLIIIAMIPSALMAQSNDPLEVNKYILDNGLTVYLNEDHQEPKVYGRVAIKVGSKNDPVDATGMAHYFEHIMFKGTDRIGTIDYQSEKAYLDSINLMYDSLGLVTNEDQRNLVIAKINDLTIKSAEYAIPNETDIILKEYGSTALNAYTSFERTVYHNTFPPHQIERWLEIYFERFRNPVFRLFQSELETVYEERNMYADMMGSEFQDDILKKFFQKHPYGQQKLIGSIEHLKNPSITKMNQFYKDYYVANNMALILSGDFDTETVLPIIKEKFGKLPSGKVPVFDKEKYKEEDFKGREFHSARLMPIRIGIIAYRGVPNNHPDEDALNLCNGLLTNSGQTGMADRMMDDNDALQVAAQSMQFNDEGINAIIFLPKIVGGKSLKELEEIIISKVDSIKQGLFDEELLKSLKFNYKKNYLQAMESASRRASYIEEAFITGYEWEKQLGYIEDIEKITKEDIVRVANKYFTSNYLIYNNKSGLPKKGEKIEKPNIKPIPVKNVGEKSAYAKEIAKIKTVTPKPIFIDFDKDFQYFDIKDKVHVYSSKNPINEIFSLNITFGVGTNTDKLLDPATMLLKELGTNSKTLKQIRKELQKIGTSYYAYSGSNKTTLNISGFDEHLEQSIQIIADVLKDLKPDEKQMEKVIQMFKGDEKMSKKDQDALDDALLNYVLYGEKSDYIDKLVLKDVKELSSEQLINSLKQIFDYETDIFYVGQLDPKNVGKLILREFPFKTNLKPKDNSIKHIQKYDENLVYVVHNKRAVQSAINIYSPSEKVTKEDKKQAALFNEYFGGGMSSVVFQEIREFRSLAYGVYVRFRTYSNTHPDEKAYIQGFLSTQSDKTIDAMNAMDSIISFMPQKPERMEIIRKAYKESINTKKPNFRSLPYSAAYWMKESYTEDPRRTTYQYFESADFPQVMDFYNKFVQGRPKVYMIVGNTKNFDMEELKRFGKVIELDKKDIRRF